MPEITASLVKELREKSGAGMMDCKKALSESGGDFEKAIDWLRTKGLSAAAKKSSRTTAEGLIALKIYENKASAVELNAETDFVARNEKFQQLANNIAEVSLNIGEDIDKIKSAKYPNSDKSVNEVITDHIATIGENMNLRRIACLSVNDGIIAHYIHNSVAEGLGKIGVLVALESKADKEKLLEFGKKIAMHVAAAKPEALTAEEVDPASIEREKAIFIEQAKSSGKPENIIEKMVEGRIRKFYTEVVLLEQIFVMDGKTKISDLINEQQKVLGNEIKLKNYVRFELGEGIEQEQSNFADEVASMAKK